MKATAAQYAKTLYELTKDKNHKEIDEVVSGFLEMLRKNGEMRKIGEIEGKFGEVYNSENGIIEADVTTREKISESLETKIKHFLKEKHKAEKVEINVKVDEGVKGGIIIRVGDEIVDGSLDRKLVELKKELSK